ncbi:hypothetical protein PVAP13_2NG258312 [Panicum virgatum]|uniref:Uncharacterized protein n=1 Tax=Panicum virgatum TaxID=38727 RepID=A0A8T0VMC7_PANVG|nr:hypothetical protein PVAP13_2NG258312 [Panicum virgatum]
MLRCIAPPLAGALPRVICTAAIQTPHPNRSPVPSSTPSPRSSPWATSPPRCASSWAPWSASLSRPSPRTSPRSRPSTRPSRSATTRPALRRSRWRRRCSTASSPSATRPPCCGGFAARTDRAGPTPPPSRGSAASRTPGARSGRWPWTGCRPRLSCGRQCGTRCCMMPGSRRRGRWRRGCGCRRPARLWS